MTETEEFHNLQLEWGCITNLTNKISDIEDRIEGGWPELIDMVADVIAEEGENKDSTKAFFSLYQFMFRLYYRLKANSERRPFNRIREDENAFYVGNYDYKFFQWAQANGFGKYIGTEITVPKDMLTDKQMRAFGRRKETKQ